MLGLKLNQVSKEAPDYSGQRNIKNMIYRPSLERSCLTGRFLAQRVNNAERALMWFHRHVSMANTLSILLILDFWYLVLSDGIVISSHQSYKYNADLDVYKETWCIIEVGTLGDVAEVLKVWYSNWL